MRLRRAPLCAFLAMGLLAASAAAEDYIETFDEWTANCHLGEPFNHSKAFRDANCPPPTDGLSTYLHNEEINLTSGPGCRTGQCVKVDYHGNETSGRIFVRGESWRPDDRELFVRFYMKLDPNFATGSIFPREWKVARWQLTDGTSVSVVTGNDQDIELSNPNINGPRALGRECLTPDLNLENHIGEWLKVEFYYGIQPNGTWQCGIWVTTSAGEFSDVQSGSGYSAGTKIKRIAWISANLSNKDIPWPPGGGSNLRTVWYDDICVGDSIEDRITTCADGSGLPDPVELPPVPDPDPDPDPDPGTAGLSGLYPGDEGIENDPRVVFAEDFEGASVSSVTSRWSDIQNSGGLQLTGDRPSASSGSKALELRAVGGSTSGAHLFRRLPTNYDTLYMRYYVKYESTREYKHSGGMLGGYSPATSYPQGTAGVCPDGDDRFSVSIEPTTDTGRLDFYTYWRDMHPLRNGNCWGNTLINDSAVSYPNRWFAVEMMVKMNDPTSSSNGELVMWIDGVKVAHHRQGSPNGTWSGDRFVRGSGSPFEGFQWRTTEALGINWTWLIHYAPDVGGGDVSRMWVDDLVVATEYIGPISDGEGGGGPGGGGNEPPEPPPSEPLGQPGQPRYKPSAP